MWVGRHSASSVRIHSPKGRTLRKVAPLVPLAAVASPHCAQCVEQHAQCCSCCSAMCTECVRQETGNDPRSPSLDSSRRDAIVSRKDDTCNCAESHQANGVKKQQKKGNHSCGCF